MSKPSTTQSLMQVSRLPADAKLALKKAIPSMSCGIRINTVHGDFSLLGEDAEAVMELVTQIAQRRSQKA